MSFREGLEAFLILILIFRFLTKTENQHLNRSVIYGFISSIVFSLVFGGLLFIIGSQFDNLDEIGKVWESIISIVAVGFVTSFIIWMIRHGDGIKSYVESKTAFRLTKKGIYIISFVLVGREGVEIALFSFAGQYHYLSVVIGIFLAMIVALGIFFSLFRINISVLFKITLLYIIIQVGYLLGYGIHEGLSALNSTGYLESNSFLLTKAYDMSNTVLNHKEGIIGLPLNILVGWYSKPEWTQLFAQYTFTIYLLLYWLSYNRKKSKLSV
ncbi:MAG: FTR1 family protein [Patescibacteria group bacterium]